MRLDDLRHRALPDGRVEISMRARWADGSEPFPIWIRAQTTFGGPQPGDASPFVAGVLTLCMVRDEPLEIEAPVSPRLLEGLEQVQRVLQTFWPEDLRVVDVRAGAAVAPPAGPPSTASFFTRGADSWYTLLTASDDGDGRPELSHGIYVPSADLWDAERAERDRARTEHAAARVGIALLAPETNLREISEPHLDWVRFHMSFLAACGLALGPSHLLSPSGAALGELLPDSQHPLVTPHYSTERTEVVWHGDATRFEKLRRIADSPDALDTLRVCWMVEGNCGRCVKCLHTMAALEAAGALHRSAAFAADRVAPRDVARCVTFEHSRHRWRLLAAAHPPTPEGDDFRLAAAATSLRHRLEQVRDEAAAARLGLAGGTGGRVFGTAEPQLRGLLDRAAALEVELAALLEGIEPG